MSYLSDRIRNEFESTFDCIVDYYYSFLDIEKSLRDNFDGSIESLGKYFRRCSNSAYMLEKIRAGNMKLGWLMRDEVIKDVENGKFHRESELVFEDSYRSQLDRDVISREVDDHVERMRCHEPMLCYEVRKRIARSDDGALLYKTWLMDEAHPVTFETGKLEVMPKSLPRELVHTAALFECLFVEPVVVVSSRSLFFQEEIARRFGRYGVYSPRDVLSGSVEGEKFDQDFFLKEEGHRYWFEKISSEYETRSIASLVAEFMKDTSQQAFKRKMFLNPDLWTK